MHTYIFVCMHTYKNVCNFEYTTSKCCLFVRIGIAILFTPQSLSPWANSILLCLCQVQVLSLQNAATADFNRTNWNWQFTPPYRSSHFKSRHSTLRAAKQVYMCVNACVLLLVWTWLYNMPKQCLVKVFTNL